VQLLITLGAHHTSTLMSSNSILSISLRLAANHHPLIRVFTWLYRLSHL